MTLNTPTPGTIPALTQYQPGALPAAGTEAVEIVNTTAASTAASYFWLVTDMVGKTPSVLPGRAPGGNDLLAFFRVADGLPYSTPISSLGIPSGNLPAGGATAQILSKNSGVNFDTSWVNISSLLAAGTSLAVSGTSVVTVGVSNFGIGSTQIATHAVGNDQIRQGAGLSIIGVTGTSTADVADIVGTAGQILAVNAGGTGLAFRAATAVMPGPFQASSFTLNGIVYGNAGSVLGVTAAGGTSLPLLGQGAVNAPAFGVLPVIGGGTGTTSLTSHGLLLGAGTAQLGVAVPSTAGNILVDQGTASDPTFRTVAGDLTFSALGTATVATNAITLSKLAQGTGLSVLAYNTTTLANATVVTAQGAPGETLMVNSAGTGLTFSLPSMLLLNTITPNNVATAGDTTHISSAFTDYLITWDNVVPGTNNSALRIQVSTVSVFLTSNYFCNMQVDAGGTTLAQTDLTGILLSGTTATTTVGNGTSYGCSGYARLSNAVGLNNRKMFVGNFTLLNGTTPTATSICQGHFGGWQDDSNAALTGIQFSFSSGNIATGIIKIYGLR